MVSTYNPALVGALLPMIQLMIAVRDGDARLLQIANGAGYVSGGHVVAGIAIKTNGQNALMMPGCSRYNEVVQVFEITVVPG